MKKVIVSVVFSSVILTCLMPQELVLPDLQGYKRLTNYPVYTPENLWDFINGAADSYLSYGFVDLHVAEYQKGRNVIKLEIYRHKDNIQAFGIYSSERSPTFRFLSIGGQGYRAGAALNFFKGQYYVKIRTNSGSEKVIQYLETLALKVADMLNGEAVMPETLADFPDNGRKNNEETYIGEAVLGHEFLRGAFRASYEAGDLGFSVFIIDKNTPADAQKTALDWLSKADLEADDLSGGRYVFRDGYNGDIFLAWKETRIVFIQGLPKNETAIADRFISEILK